MKIRPGRGGLCGFLRRDLLFAVLLFLELAVLAEQTILWNVSTEPSTLTAENGLSCYAADAKLTENGIENGESTGIFGATRWIALRAGMYRITVHYQPTEETAAHFKVYSTLALANDTAAMPAESTESSLTVWLPQRVDDLQLHFGIESGHVAVQSVDIVPVNNNAAVLRLLALFLLADALYLLLRRRLPKLRGRPSAVLLCLLAVTVFSSAPLFSTQLVRGDDMIFHLNRIEGLAQELALGTQLPVYIQSAWMGGQGYPVSVFYNDLFLYFPAFLRLIGFPLQTAFQIYTVGINALTAFTAWWAFRRIFKSDATAVFASALYCLCPYRLVDLYRRTALGEYTALAFAPLVLAGLWEVFTLDPDSPRYRRCWVPLAVGYWGLLQSHLITTELCGIFTIVLCVCLCRRTLRPKTFFALCKGAAAVGVASLWYIVPLFDYMQKGGFVVTSQSVYQDIQNAGSFLGQLTQVFAAGSGGGKNLQEGLAGDMVQTPGAALLLALLAFLVYTVLRPDAAPQRALCWRGGRAAAVGAGAALAACLWTTPWNLTFSLPLIGKLISTVQFPWRCLGLACLLLAMVAAALSELLRPRRELRLAFVCVLAVCCTLEAGYVMSTCQDNAEVLHICDGDALDSFDCGNGEYLPDVCDIYNKDYYQLSQTPTADDGVTVESWQRTGASFTAEVSAPAGGSLTAPLLEYPYYQAEADGETLAITRSDTGQLTIALPEGFSGTVTVRFVPPLLWRAAFVVSLLFAAALAAMALWSVRKGKKERGSIIKCR